MLSIYNLAIVPVLKDESIVELAVLKLSKRTQLVAVGAAPKLQLDADDQLGVPLPLVHTSYWKAKSGYAFAPGITQTGVVVKSHPAPLKLLCVCNQVVDSPVTLEGVSLLELLRVELIVLFQ